MNISPQEVLKYINLAREYPKYYVALIDEQLNSFIDSINIKLDEEVIYQTIEGKSAWESAKQFLIDQEPLRPFDHHEGLFKASSDHARDIMTNNSSGHVGSDGSTFIDRLQRYCKKGKGSMIELLGTTYLINDKNSIELALINLIIDDGVQNRGHRKAIFNKDYRYIGASFWENSDKIYSVISMSQSKMEEIKSDPQNIATSTSHLQSTNNLESEIREQSVRSFKENSIQGSERPSEKDVKVFKVDKSELRPVPTNDVWTLKNVTNQSEKPVSKKSVSSRQSIPQKLEAEPSINYNMEESGSSKTSKSSITSSKMVDEKPVRDNNRESRVSKRAPSSQENTLKMSQNSIKSEKSKNGPVNNFGLSSNVEEFKVKSTFNSPFLKTNTSGFGASNAKKVVEKKQTMRTWNEEEFLIKEVTTVLKYDDGSMQDWVEKHSVIKEGAQ